MTHKEKNKPKILFLSNKRSLPYTDCNQLIPVKLSSGLSNSIKFVVDMLQNRGYECEYEQVIDSNSIDKIVTGYKPQIVILEAIWFTPIKLKELAKIYTHSL